MQLQVITNVRHPMGVLNSFSIKDKMDLRLFYFDVAISGKQVQIIIDNFKKSTKSSTKHCNSKNFHLLRNILQNIFFFYTNFSQVNFLHCPTFL